MHLSENEALAHVWSLPEHTREQCEYKAARLMTLACKCRDASLLVEDRGKRIPLLERDLPEYARHLAGAK